LETCRKGAISRFLCGASAWSPSGFRTPNVLRGLATTSRRRSYPPRATPLLPAYRGARSMSTATGSITVSCAAPRRHIPCSRAPESRGWSCATKQSPRSLPSPAPVATGAPSSAPDRLSRPASIFSAASDCMRGCHGHADSAVSLP